jgi:outer membrane immunogenic protein
MFRKPDASGGIPVKDESRCGSWFKPLAAVSALALAGAVTMGSAQAADLYEPRESLKDAPSAGPRACALFQGFYIGGHAGSGSYDWSWDDRDAWANGANSLLPHSVSDTESGFIGGVQGGFNWQRGCTVFGLEADWSWAGLDGTERHTNGGSTSLTVSSDVGGFGTVRMRSGVVVDSLLIYATGGFAFAEIDRNWTVQNGNDLPVSFSSDDRRWGWTAGVGTEWAIADRISLKSEALYLRFEDDTFTRTSGGENKRFDHEDAVWVGRVGLNFKLGGGGGPLPY